MSTKLKLNISIASLAFIFFILIFIQMSIGFSGLADFIKYSFCDKNNLRLNMSLINPSISSIAAEPSNKLALGIQVKDCTGAPIPMANVVLSIEGNEKSAGDLGHLSPSVLRTDKNGECIITYSPPEAGKDFFTQKKTSINIVAKIKDSDIETYLSIKLARNPVVFIHGYQAYAYVFDNFGEYLNSKDFSTGAIEYKSVEGVLKASNILRDFLQKQKMEYLEKGFQVQKFDIVAHSMGGLVARHYTSSEDFIKADNVRKIIFISVPQKGSPWASVGASFFNDKGVMDLVPENNLISKLLPGMINKGLNNRIQVGSILGQFDEVVSPESASLEEWNLSTELFSIGQSNLDFNNILKGNFSEATNHMNILSNKKVFQKVENMLYQKLPYPSLKK